VARIVILTVLSMKSYICSSLVHIILYQPPQSPSVHARENWELSYVDSQFVIQYADDVTKVSVVMQLAFCIVTWHYTFPVIKKKNLKEKIQ